MTGPLQISSRKNKPSGEGRLTNAGAGFPMARLFMKSALFQAFGFRNTEDVLTGKGQVAFVPRNHFKVMGIL